MSRGQIARRTPRPRGRVVKSLVVGGCGAAFAWWASVVSGCSFASLEDDVAEPVAIALTAAYAPSAPPPAFPPPAVALPGKAFVDGDALPLDGSGAMWLTTLPGEGSRGQTLVLRNEAETTQTISVSVSDGFSLVDLQGVTGVAVPVTSLGTRVTSGGLFTVRINAEANAPAMGTLTVSIGAPMARAALYVTPARTNHLRVEREGRALPDPVPAPVTLGTATLGATFDQSLGLWNDREETLYFRGVTLPAGVTLVGAAPATLAPSARGSLTLRLATTALGTKLGALSVSYWVGSPPSASVQPDVESIRVPVSWVVAPVTPPSPAYTVSLNGTNLGAVTSVSLAFTSPTQRHTISFANTGKVPLYARFTGNPPLVVTGPWATQLANAPGRTAPTFAPGAYGGATFALDPDAFAGPVSFSVMVPIEVFR